MTIRELSQFELRPARRDIDRQLAEIRSTGSTVEVRHDFGVAVLALVSPLVQPGFDSGAWGMMREPAEMWICASEIREDIARFARSMPRDGDEQ
jgi:hypothetical protein